MDTTELNAYAHKFPDITIIEIFNPDEQIWEYYISREDNANLEYSFGVEHRFTVTDIKNLWNNGYFD